MQLSNFDWSTFFYQLQDGIFSHSFHQSIRFEIELYEETDKSFSSKNALLALQSCLQVLGSSLTGANSAALIFRILVFCFDA